MGLRTFMWQQLVSTLGASVIFLLAANAHGEASDDLQEKIYTAYLFTDFGLATYKSELVASNDTGSVVSYAFGGHVGEQERFGIGMKTDTSTFSFLLNESSISTTWTDWTLKYRLWFFELGAIIAYNKATVVQEGTPLFDAIGQGYGGHFTAYYPINRKVLMALNVDSVSISQVTEVDKKSVTFGSRMDIDLRTNVDITKNMLDFIFGYRQRSYTMGVDGASGSEAITATYLGLQAGASF